MPVNQPDKLTLQGVIHTGVEPAAIVCTDDHRVYTRLEGYEYGKVSSFAKEFTNGMAHADVIESVWPKLKRGYNRMYRNWRRKHAGRYVNELFFHLNDGNFEVDAQDQIAALFRRMAGKTITYCKLAG